ncbi:type II toxin-antitoxin system PemK/MazF family toxin [uncultured Sphingomonas sp.]|uniref:type II toxin-antitoxin system PemK/MazF family toxin n=1 Tax=uncultured Sphingomonas sp. TaxID=158754 RepID=UPI0035CA31AF
MEIKRGAVVVAAAPGEYSGKPRPFLVVQSDLFNATHGSITMCTITSNVGGELLFRVPLSPTADTGLRLDSEVQIDKILTLRRSRIVDVIGSVPQAVMEQVDQGLRRWQSL